jgi:hypothetical protein
MEITANTPAKRYTDKHIISSLVKNQGRVSAVAREFGVTSQTISNRMRRNPALMEEYNTILDELVDDAIDALRVEINNGNTRLIEFALDRLGRNRGFEKQTVRTETTVKGDPSNPITIERRVDMEGLSLEEKIILMKASKNKMIDTIDVTPVEEALDD